MSANITDAFNINQFKSRHYNTNQLVFQSNFSINRSSRRLTLIFTPKLFPKKCFRTASGELGLKPNDRPAVFHETFPNRTQSYGCSHPKFVLIRGLRRVLSIQKKDAKFSADGIPLSNTCLPGELCVTSRLIHHHSPRYLTWLSRQAVMSTEQKLTGVSEKRRKIEAEEPVGSFFVPELTNNRECQAAISKLMPREDWVPSIGYCFLQTVCWSETGGRIGFDRIVRS